MRLMFNQSFGAYQNGTEADVPDQVATSLVRAGVAVQATDAPPAPVSKTEAYKPSKGVGKAVRKRV
jgi:hypothetical protein